MTGPNASRKGGVGLALFWSPLGGGRGSGLGSALPVFMRFRGLSVHKRPRATILNPYKILGIAEDATLDEIKAAYRERARRYHPDAGGDAWAFQQVQQAYDMLLEKHRSSESSDDAPHTQGSTPSRKEDVPPLSNRNSNEPAILAGVFAILLTFVLWRWVWRLVFIFGGIGLGVLGAWLFILSAKDLKEHKGLNLGGGVVAAILAAILLGYGVYGGTGRSSPVVAGQKDAAPPQSPQPRGNNKMVETPPPVIDKFWPLTSTFPYIRIPELVLGILALRFIAAIWQSMFPEKSGRRRPRKTEQAAPTRTDASTD